MSSGTSIRSSYEASSRAAAWTGTTGATSLPGCRSEFYTTLALASQLTISWQDVDPEHPEHLPDQMKLPPIRESMAFDKEARELDKEQPSQEPSKTGKGCTYL